MPIPLLFLGIAAVTAAVGTGKSIKAVSDQKDATDTNDRANRIVDLATSAANLSRKNSGNAVTALGEKKIWILDKGIQPFLKSFDKIHNIDFTPSQGLQEIKNMKMDKQSFEELGQMQTMASSIAGGITGGSVLGATTAFGAYGAVSALASASTGTAIASLSGVAASNATLAFLGGGTLAAGGLGVAGGTMVLGGLVAGPALAVMGFIVGAKASANRDEAYSNLSKAEAFEEEMKTVRVLCKGIRMRAALFERLLIKLDGIFEPNVLRMNQIIRKSGTDYSNYSDADKKIVIASMSTASAIKAVLDTPILTEDGKITPESNDIADEVNRYVSTAQTNE